MKHGKKYAEALKLYDKLNLYISKEEALKIVQSANGGCIMDAGMKMNFSKIIQKL